MAVSELRIGYARMSTNGQGLGGQRGALQALGRVYTDHGLTGTHRDRPSLADRERELREQVVAIANAGPIRVGRLRRATRRRLVEARSDLGAGGQAL
jgi:hypothetical protein